MTTPKGNIFANGSFGLIDTGKMKLLITCHHVWNEFKKLRAEKPELMFGLCIDIFNPIMIPDPDSLFVDECRRCDLATFDMGTILDAFTPQGLQFFNVHANRPPKLNNGENLYMIGFPGKGREDNQSSVGFVRQPIAVTATQVGVSKFFADVSKFRLRARDFGGISGCPCFVIWENRPIRLVGFATGFGEDNLGLLQFTYARYIQPNGVIQYMA